MVRLHRVVAKRSQGKRIVAIETADATGKPDGVVPAEAAIDAIRRGTDVYFVAACLGGDVAWSPVNTVITTRPSGYMRTAPDGVFDDTLLSLRDISPAAPIPGYPATVTLHRVIGTRRDSARIVEIETADATGSSEGVWPVDRVVAAIDAGTDAFFVAACSGRDVVWSPVAIFRRDGKKFIKTHPDGILPDRLDQLPAIGAAAEAVAVET